MKPGFDWPSAAVAAAAVAAAAVFTAGLGASPLGATAIGSMAFGALAAGAAPVARARRHRASLRALQASMLGGAEPTAGTPPETGAPPGRDPRAPLGIEALLAEHTGHPAPWSEDEVAGAMRAQLSRPFQGLDAEPAHRRVLAVLFEMRANGRHDFYASATRHLGEAAASGDRGRLEAEVAALDASAGVAISGAPGSVPDRHAFSETVLMGLLARSREAAEVPSADLLWVRALDRPLWAALATVGRPSHLPEALGAAAHFEAERALGRAVREPAVDPAVRAVMGWLRQGRGEPEEPCRDSPPADVPALDPWVGDGAVDRLLERARSDLKMARERGDLARAREILEGEIPALQRMRAASGIPGEGA